jgi:hypothetical protein
MDETFYIPAVAIGLLLILLHLLVSWRRHRGPDLLSIVSCLLHSSCLVAGGVIILSVFMPTLRTRVQHLGVYLVIGGVAALYVSFQGAYQAVKGKP